MQLNYTKRKPEKQRRLNNFKKWNEEVKGKYVGKIVTIERKIKELENKNENRKKNKNSGN